MKHKALGLACIGVGMHAIPVYAHHSFGMFDHEHPFELSGVVKEFKFTSRTPSSVLRSRTLPWISP